MDIQTKNDAIEGLTNRIERRRELLQKELTTVVDGKTYFQRWLSVSAMAGPLEDQVRGFAQMLQDEQKAIRESVRSLNKLGAEPVA